MYLNFCFCNDELQIFNIHLFQIQPIFGKLGLYLVNLAQSEAT